MYLTKVKVKIMNGFRMKVFRIDLHLSLSSKDIVKGDSRTNTLDHMSRLLVTLALSEKKLFGDFFSKVAENYAETGTIWLARCLYLSTYLCYCLCCVTVLFLLVIIVSNHSVQVNKCFSFFLSYL
jgi:hypothetical protein